MSTTRHSFHITRDLVLFAVGIAGIIFETLSQGSERPALLAVFAGMVGLPVFLRLDNKHPVYEKEKADD